MRRAYDYWQNQPGCYLPHEARDPAQRMQIRRRHRFQRTRAQHKSAPPEPNNGTQASQAESHKTHARASPHKRTCPFSLSLVSQERSTHFAALFKLRKKSGKAAKVVVRGLLEQTQIPSAQKKQKAAQSQQKWLRSRQCVSALQGTDLEQKEHKRKS